MLRTVRHPIHAAVFGVIIALTLSSCSESTAPNGAGDRYYRLGNEADLLLHDDGTYAFAEGSNIEFSGPGRWTQRSDTLVITPADGRTAWIGVVSGDTLTVAGQRDHGRLDGGSDTFRLVREPLPPNTVVGTRWVLREAIGAASRPGAGFLVANADVNGVHLVRRIARDTITFTDRVFFRESRAAVDSVFYTDTRVPYASSYAYASDGAYGLVGDVVTFRYGSAFGSGPTVSISGTQLTRRYQVGADAIQEHYERIP